MKGQEITMNASEIADAVLTWNNYPGFTGETCHKCKASVNTFGGGPGWVCPNCDAYNAQCWHGGPMPHDAPDFGPTQQTIRSGHILSDVIARRQRKYIDNELVVVNMKPYPYRAHEAVWRAAVIVKLLPDCSFGMRYYIVKFLNGETKRVYEPDITSVKDATLTVQRESLVDIDGIVIGGILVGSQFTSRESDADQN